MNPIIVIAGATATGKTAAAVALAKKINGEVVSADSMQVYKGMDIGTAKPTTAEMEGVPHHLLSIIEPHEPFSVALYQKLATSAINDIHARGAIPILAGGTGFYIKAVLQGAEFSDEEVNEENQTAREIQLALADEAQKNGTTGAETLHQKLSAIDPDAARAIHPNNIKRVARALGFCICTGRLFSQYNAAQREKKFLYATTFCVLSFPRNVLYNRINTRTQAMFNSGLIAETETLLSKGFHKGLAALNGIGYKETIQFLNAQLTLPETINAVSQATRNYAKRQETWFRNQAPNAHIIPALEKSPNELATHLLTPPVFSDF